jgi:hypothetical protein
MLGNRTQDDVDFYSELHFENLIFKGAPYFPFAVHYNGSLGGSPTALRSEMGLIRVTNNFMQHVSSFPQKIKRMVKIVSTEKLGKGKVVSVLN